MTTPKVRCDYCGYLGEWGVDIIRDNEEKFCCVECGTDDLKRMIKREVNKKMTEFKNISLGEIFNDNEIENIIMVINNNDWKYLRKYLNAMKTKLGKKGILPDYLYYCLEAQFKNEYRDE